MAERREDPITGVPVIRLTLDGNDLPVEPGEVFVLIDIKDLRHLNQTKGKDFGDAVLRATASRLTSEGPRAVYRIGADEFLAVFTRVQPDAIRPLSTRIRRALARPVSGESVAVTVGVAIASEDATFSHAAALADRALVAAQQNGWPLVIAPLGARLDHWFTRLDE